MGRPCSYPTTVGRGPTTEVPFRGRSTHTPLEPGGQCPCPHAPRPHSGRSVNGVPTVVIVPSLFPPETSCPYPSFSRRERFRRGKSVVRSPTDRSEGEGSQFTDRRGWTVIRRGGSSVPPLSFLLRGTISSRTTLTSPRESEVAKILGSVPGGRARDVSAVLPAR